MELTIIINGQLVTVEVTAEVYDYLKQAARKEENLAHEQRRHWDSREFDEETVFIEGRSHYYITPEQWVCRMETMQEIRTALMVCTENQRRRFLLYAVEGMSFSEIAYVCGCSKGSVQQSIEAVRKKFQRIF